MANHKEVATARDVQEVPVEQLLLKMSDGATLYSKVYTIRA